MPVSINGTTGVTAPEVTLDNATADGGQVVLSSSGFSNWNLDNFSGRLRAYYGSTEYLTLTNAGNLGIGTSSPINLLTVQTAATGTTAGSNVIARLQSNASGRDATLQFSDNVANSATISMVGGATVFRQNGIESARIDSSSNFLVGTTSVLGKQTNAYDGATAFGLALANTAGGTAGQIAIRFMRNGSDVGSVTTTSTATAYNTSSDYRLKEQVQPMTGALSVVQQLKPCTYKWKADGSDGEGFIAHELQAVCPDAVTGEKDAVDAEGNPVYQGIDTSFLVATLTAAIQELKAIVDQQATEIANLKGQV